MKNHIKCTVEFEADDVQELNKFLYAAKNVGDPSKSPLKLSVIGYTVPLSKVDGIVITLKD